MNSSLVFITKFYFSVSKKVRLNSAHYLIMKTHNKRELQNIAIKHSANIDYKYFMKIYKKCKSEPYPCLTIDATLSANNSLRFKKNLLNHL